MAEYNGVDFFDGDHYSLTNQFPNKLSRDVRTIPRGMFQRGCDFCKKLAGTQTELILANSQSNRQSWMHEESCVRICKDSDHPSREIDHFANMTGHTTVRLTLLISKSPTTPS